MSGDSVRSVRFLVPPRVDATLAYQRYYLIGLDRAAALSFAGAPARARLGAGPSRKVDLIVPAKPLRVARRLLRLAVSSGQVARYELRSGGAVRTFAIDATDNHVLRNPELADEVDLYFKANRWPSAEYPENVRPLVNGNGFVTPARLEELRALRDTPKSTDVAFITNIWGGREHNVRILEELAGAGVAADLLAVLPEGERPEDDAEVERRLAAAGVRAVRTAIGMSELWRRLARARVVVIRSGRHLCIPWRMIDLLAMGSCILFDAEPLPQWPVPLRSDVEYACMGIERPAWEAPAADEYAKVVPALERLLCDDELRASHSAHARAYFEQHARPEAVGRYVLDTLQEAAA